MTRYPTIFVTALDVIEKRGNRRLPRMAETLRIDIGANYLRNS
jgi:hypothetical protein